MEIEFLSLKNKNNNIAFENFQLLLASNKNYHLLSLISIGTSFQIKKKDEII